MARFARGGGRALARSGRLRRPDRAPLSARDPGVVARSRFQRKPGPESIADEPQRERKSVEGYTDALPFGANLALRSSVLEVLRFDEEVGPVAGVSYAQGSEYELLTRLRQRGERIVHVPDAQVAHVILPHQVELEWLFGRAERIGRGSARVKRKRVPSTIFGWIPLCLNLWRARWRAHRARHLAEPERFRIAHRAYYWRGYIAESRALRRGHHLVVRPVRSSPCARPSSLIATAP